jgi:hypothetical protein
MVAEEALVLCGHHGVLEHLRYVLTAYREVLLELAEHGDLTADAVPLEEVDVAGLGDAERSRLRQRGRQRREKQGPERDHSSRHRGHYGTHRNQNQDLDGSSHEAPFSRPIRSARHGAEVAALV